MSFLASNIVRQVLFSYLYITRLSGCQLRPLSCFAERESHLSTFLCSLPNSAWLLLSWSLLSAGGRFQHLHSALRSSLASVATRQSHSIKKAFLHQLGCNQSDSVGQPCLHAASVTPTRNNKHISPGPPQIREPHFHPLEPHSINLLPSLRYCRG